MELATTASMFTEQTNVAQNINNVIGSSWAAQEDKTMPIQAHSLVKAKELLDEMFPLANGSHQDVSSYVVYYQHLLAFFKDGSQSGLCQPQQFVALSGHKEKPDAILLNSKGLHLALCFDRKGKMGKEDLANMDDILLEGHENWISLANTGEQTATPKQAQFFTAKDGGDYRIK